MTSQIPTNSLFTAAKKNNFDELYEARCKVDAAQCAKITARNKANEAIAAAQIAEEAARKAEVEYQKAENELMIVQVNSTQSIVRLIRATSTIQDESSPFASPNLAHKSDSEYIAQPLPLVRTKAEYTRQPLIRTRAVEHVFSPQDLADAETLGKKWSSRW